MNHLVCQSQSLLKIKEEVRLSIQQLLIAKGKDTNYVNKRLQDSIVNFFLEDYVTPIFGIDSSTKKSFHESMKQIASRDEQIEIKSPKYMQLLDVYLSQLKKESLLSDYRKMLIEICFMNEGELKGDNLTLLWRKQLCVLLLEHLEDSTKNTIYKMWNSAYPQNPIYNKKESFYRKTIKPRKIAILREKALKSQQFQEDQISEKTNKTSFQSQIRNSHMEIDPSFSSSCSQTMIQLPNNQIQVALKLLETHRKTSSFCFNIISSTNSLQTSESTRQISIILLQ